MSRKYCAVCNMPHANQGLGLCDKHLVEEEAAEYEERGEREKAWEYFQENKVQVIFDFIYEKGWRP
jgi:hypothetical protein